MRTTRDLHADLPLAFTIHPVHNDVLPIIDLVAIKASVRNLVLTNYYDRVFHPEIGGDVTSLLFENADMYTALAISDQVKRVIDRFEPRVTGVIVDVRDDSDKNAFEVTVGFLIKPDLIPGEATFFLNRNR